MYYAHPRARVMSFSTGRRLLATIDAAALFLYTAEHPYPLYSCITAPLNISGACTLQSLQQQLPFIKLFSLALCCLPKDGPYRSFAHCK
jgi:hypothetical protein